MLRKFAGICAVSIFAIAGASAANASCEGRTTTGTIIGAGAGGLLGNVITHGNAVGTIGGAVVGGVAGHEIGRSGCYRHYYRTGYYGYRHHHYYRTGYYRDYDRDYYRDYDRDRYYDDRDRYYNDRDRGGYYDSYGYWHSYD